MPSKRKSAKSKSEPAAPEGYLGHNEEPEVPSPYYNCGSCGDRILSNDQHTCWVYHKMQDQEQYKDNPTPYADFSGSEDVVARLKKPPQYEVYS